MNRFSPFYAGLVIVVLHATTPNHTPAQQQSETRAVQQANRAAKNKSVSSPALIPMDDTPTITTVRRVPLNINIGNVAVKKEEGVSTNASSNSHRQASGTLIKTLSQTVKTSDVAQFAYNPNGTLRFAEGRFGTLRNRIRHNVEMTTPYTLIANTQNRLQNEEIRSAKHDVLVQEAFSLLNQSKVLRGLENPQEELAVMSLNTDKLGFQHIRFEQTYKGLRVHGRDVYVHADAKGDVYSIHGLYEPTPAQELSAVPAITQESAFIATRNALAEEGLWKSISPNVLAIFGAERAWKGELLWYPAQTHANPRSVQKTTLNTALRLAFAVTVTTSIKRSWTYFIDAHSGEVLSTLRLHRDDQDYLDRFKRTDRNNTYASEAAISGTAKNDATLSISSGAEVDKNGTIIQTPPSKGEAKLQSTGFIDVPSTTAFDENVNVRSWRRESDGHIFPVSDYLSSETPTNQLPSRINGGSLILDARNTEVEDVSNASIVFITDGQRWRRDIASALAYTDSCRRYFALRHDRTSWNGQGARIHTLLNVGKEGSTSAWWNQGLMSQGYGDGGGVADERHPNRDLYLYGHEVGHAYNTVARLEYNNGETGALEEHFANLWGWMLDRTTNYYSPRLRGYGNVPGEGLHWGEADSTGAGWQAVRNMRDFFVFGTPRAQGLQFPHANAPIADRVSWLFFRRYGRDTTERIWWRTLSTYMTQNASFGDWRRHTLRAAEDLYPGNTDLANALNAAFDDVGITASMPTASRKISDGSAAELTAVTSVIAFTTQSGRIGLYNPATNRASLFSGSEAVVRTQGGRSQVSAANNGRLLYFVNTRGQVATLDLMTNAVSTLPGIQIRSAGDIASVAISPDGRSLAMTSTDANDANIYLVTVATIAANGITRPRIIPLKRLVGTTSRPLAEGRQVSGIRYPDAIAWSPDSRTPELVFDAYHELTLEGETVPFWALYYSGMGSTPSVFELYPPQPDYNLGFPSYSSRNANTLVFSEYFPEGDVTVNDLYVANFDRDNDQGYLGIRRFTLNNRPIVDADQAVFSPDDRQLCFTSAANPRALLFYTFTSGTVQASLRAVTLDSTVVRPFWANLDIATSVREEQLAQGTMLGLGISPNPASEQTSVRFVVPQSQRVTLKLYSSLGQEILTIADGIFPQGEHTLMLSAKELPHGVYLCHLQIGEAVEVQKISIIR